ncbi:LysM peptidoglycan-binding domain-containing protein [Akkermansiaceae bacterium]|nr:LysM peptidoglycan-binding domain-containing protein [Akkermansiaceae bacterium]
MKNAPLLALAALSATLASCSPQGGGGEDYDVSNPYAAPDYGDDTGTPFDTSDVNPAYDAPAVYEDTTPAASPAPAPAASATVHTVVRGDSLWKIGRQYGVTVDAIKQANGLTKDTAVLGAKLKIPAR